MPTKGKVTAEFVIVPRSVGSIRTRFRREIVALAGAITFAVALIVALLEVGAGTAAKEPELHAQPPPTDVHLQTYEGMITDTSCGAKHPASTGLMAADCTLACVRRGQQFALVDGDTTYRLEGDPITLKRGAGQRVKIIGALNGKSISVTSLITAERGPTHSGHLSIEPNPVRSSVRR